MQKMYLYSIVFMSFHVFVFRFLLHPRALCSFFSLATCSSLSLYIFSMNLLHSSLSLFFLIAYCPYSSLLILTHPLLLHLPSLVPDLLPPWHSHESGLRGRLPTLQASARQELQAFKAQVEQLLGRALPGHSQGTPRGPAP